MTTTPATESSRARARLRSRGVRHAERTRRVGCADRVLPRHRVRPRRRRDPARPCGCTPVATRDRRWAHDRNRFRGHSARVRRVDITDHIDTAYGLLMQEQCPSWLYPVLQGATTIWERWDALTPDGRVMPEGISMISFNHYALGAVADWLHRVVGGLAPASPGSARDPHRANAWWWSARGVAAARDALRPRVVVVGARRRHRHRRRCRPTEHHCAHPPPGHVRGALGRLRHTQLDGAVRALETPEAGTSWGDAARDNDAQRDLPS